MERRTDCQHEWRRGPITSMYVDMLCARCLLPGILPLRYAWDYPVLLDDDIQKNSDKLKEFLDDI